MILVVMVSMLAGQLVMLSHDVSLLGYLVASSVFHNRQREDVYWLSREGRLLGVIPCLGSGPHSFCTKSTSHLVKLTKIIQEHLLSLTMAMVGLVVLTLKLIPP